MIKDDSTELITPVHSGSTAHFNDINIPYYEKIPKIGEIPLLLTWRFVKILLF